MQAALELYDRIVDPNLLVRRINIVANKVVEESSVRETETYEQLDFFSKHDSKNTSVELNKHMKKMFKEMKKSLKEEVGSVKKDFLK